MRERICQRAEKSHSLKAEQSEPETKPTCDEVPAIKKKRSGRKPKFATFSDARSIHQHASADKRNMILSTVLSLLVAANCYRLSRKENELLQKSCGVGNLGSSSTMKILGGHLIKPGEYPWMVKLHFPIDLGFIQTVTTCSASLISPRHILTAAHCTKYLSYSNVTDECDGKLKNSVFSELKPEEFAAYVGTLCNPPERCNIAHSVSKVFVDKKWDRCALLKEDKFLPFTHDLAVLELSREVSSKDAIPICLPNRKLELAKELQAAGSGFENCKFMYLVLYTAMRNVDICQ
ncbi:hypothetical protein COOONC_19251 [Cooperia oncophora]